MLHVTIRPGGNYVEPLKGAFSPATIQPAEDRKRTKNKTALRRMAGKAVAILFPSRSHHIPPE